MGMGVNIPWLGGQYTMGRGQYTMGRGVQYTMGRGVDIPWLRGSIYHAPFILRSACHVILYKTVFNFSRMKEM